MPELKLSVNEAVGILKREEEELNAIASDMNLLKGAFEDILRAKTTVENLPKKDADVMVPLPGGIIVPAKLGKPDKVFIAAGAGVTKEVTTDEASKMLEERANRIQKDMLRLDEVATKKAENARMLQQKLAETLKQEKKKE